MSERISKSQDTVRVCLVHLSEGLPGRGRAFGRHFESPSHFDTLVTRLKRIHIACRVDTVMLAKSLRDLVSAVPDGALAIQAISLKASSDLICRNIFCEKAGQPCLCKLEHALGSPSLDLSTIRRVDLSSNGLTALPPSISKMKNLEELQLSANSFSALPNFIQRLEKLTLLDLSHNPLEAKLPSPILTRKDILAIPEALLLSS
jgi:hypothetical protein